MENTLVVKFGKALALAGAILTIADFAQPLAPISAYMIVASIVLIAVLIFLKYIINKWNDHLSTLNYFGAMTLVMSIVLFLFQNQNEEAKEMGILSASIPGLSELQKSLGLVEKQLGQIAGSMKSIDKKMDNVKKETSNNPRKELRNMGVDWDGHSFYDAASRGDLKTVDLFLNGGMKPDTLVPNTHPGSSVIVKLIEKNPQPTIPMIKHFIKKGFDINKKIPYKAGNIMTGYYDVQTDLITATVIKNNSAVIKFLRKQGADLDSVKSYLNTNLEKLSTLVFHPCFNTKYYHEVKGTSYRNDLMNDQIKRQGECSSFTQNYILKEKVKEFTSYVSSYQLLFNENYKFKVTGELSKGLAVAILAGKPVLAQAYLDAGASANSKFINKDKTPMISIAAQAPNSNVFVKLLIKAGADVNAQSESKDTPLHFHIRGKRSKAIHALLEAKANKNIKNSQNASPMNVAEKQNDPNILKLLRQ